jgi:hypothetical protein
MARPELADLELEQRARTAHEALDGPGPSGIEGFERVWPQEEPVHWATRGFVYVDLVRKLRGLLVRHLVRKLRGLLVRPRLSAVELPKLRAVSDAELFAGSGHELLVVQLGMKHSAIQRSWDSVVQGVPYGMKPPLLLQRSWDFGNEHALIQDARALPRLHSG